METATLPDNSVHFENFELDLRTHELYRNGKRLKIRGHPVDVLAVLVEHPGELVTRETLQKRIWPSDTFLDFEHSLNNSVGKLRDALGDNAGSPRFIETLPRLGYRFIARVKTEIVETPAQNSANAEIPVFGQPSNVDPRGTVSGAGEIEASHSTSVRNARRRKWTLSSAMVAAVVLTAVLWYLHLPLPLPRITDYVQLTRDGRFKYVAGTDGANLYLNLWNSYVFTPSKVLAAGGPITPLVIDLPNSKDPDFTMKLVYGGISPDGTKMLVISPTDRATRSSDLWVVSTPGNPARYLTKAWGATWSPDGRQVVYTENGDLYTIPSDGGTPHLLLASPKSGATSDPIYHLSWSPDGRSIRFSRTLEQRIWEISSDGSDLRRVLPGWEESYSAYAGHWTPDGEFYVFAARPRSSPAGGITQLWILDERRGGLRPSVKQPIQLTGGPIAWELPIPSPDGQKIFVGGRTFLGELDRFDKQSDQLKPYFGGISAEYVAFSRDSKYVTYVSYPEGILWRCNRDGSGLMQLTSPPIHPIVTQWSPDGRQILFETREPSGRYFIYTVPSQGGTPTRLIPEDTEPERSATWSPDGKKVVYVTDYRYEGYRSPSGLKTRIFELDSRKTTTLPSPPEPGWSPRMSPDGRYISFLSIPDTADPMIFDLRTQRYTIVRGLPPFKSLNFNRWSRDSKSLYFVLEGGPNDESGVYRIPVSGGKAERVVDLKGFRHGGWLGLWMGLDPTDTPMLLRNVGTLDIYALTLERK